MPEDYELFIGTSGWSYPHWQGLFYPENLAKSRWFELYAATFPAVEVNATFYRRFQRQTYTKWRDRAPAHFRYILKAPRLITHRRYLLEVDDLIKEFWQSAQELGEHFGMILLQLAPRTPYDPERLRAALRAHPDPAKVAVEFRHERWLTNETRELLQEIGATFCAADSPQSDLMNWLTSEKAYIRLHGRKRWYSYDYTNKELEEIAALVLQLRTAGAREIYVFFNNDFEGYAPKNAMTLMTMLSNE